MISIEESILNSMDGTDSRLIWFLPYIFQDVWELGASPETVINLIKKYFRNYDQLKILDLGCGKGAVSINAAKEFKCNCHGIDAVQEFIIEAKQKAKEFAVDDLCHFETGDIRTISSRLTGFDVIILGAIGNVFGNYYSTLKNLSGCLNPDGKIIIDDAYVEDDNKTTTEDFETRGSILQQVNEAGMKILDEVREDQNDIAESEDFIFEKLKSRCEELIAKYPDNKNLFINYIIKQRKEGNALKKNAVCSTMLIGR